MLRCLLMFVILPCFIDTLLRSCQLGAFYDFLWRRDKGPWYRNISTAYYHWPNLWHYILLFSLLRRSLYGERTHTYIHADCRILGKFIYLWFYMKIIYYWFGSKALISLKVGLSPSKKLYLFTSMKAL